jgi:alpha-tubulin suppressor-like RCC1 family protein
MSRRLFLHVIMSSLFIVSLLASVIVPGPARPVEAASGPQPVTPMVAAGFGHTVGLMSDGTVVAVGDNTDGQCNVASWTGIQQVAAADYYTVGLKSDGTVVAVGDNTDGQCNVASWSGIQQVSAGYAHDTVGLKSDGTVVAVGDNTYGQCNVASWSGIQQVSAGGTHTVGLKSDGTVVAVGDNTYGQCNVASWTGIQQVAAGRWRTVGLKSDGTVVAVGDNGLGQGDVSSWSGIQQVAAGYYYTVGLKSDSTMVAVGFNVWGQCNVSSWTGIQQVAAGYYHTVGLKSDGTVVAEGYNDYGQCNVSSWTGIQQLSAGNQHTVGLKSDGTVVALGWNLSGQCNVSSWSGIQQVAAGRQHTVGLKSDGTVVAVGDNTDGQCNVGSWSSIQQVAAGAYHTVGLKSDGTVVAAGDNSYGQCNVSSWSGIQQVAAGYAHTVGLKSDGTVVAVGDNDYGQCNVASWTGIQQVAAQRWHTVGLKSDGTVVAVGDNSYGQCNVASWSGIQQVAAGYGHTVGLKSDGTVVAVGDNSYGQCNVGSWSSIQQLSAGETHTVGLMSDGTAVAAGAEIELAKWNLGTATADTIPPAVVTDLTAVAIASNGVLLTWTSPGDDGNTGTASTYDVRYSTSTITDANWGSASECTSWPAPKVAGSHEAFKAFGLSPNTIYYFALKTADEVPNWSGLSNVPSGQTAVAADTTPPAAVTGLAASGATTASVTLTWTAPGDDGSAGTASTYDIRYSTAAMTEANWASASQCSGEPAPKVAGSAETFTVTGLSPDTTYYLAIKTADEVPNWSALSNVPNRQTAVAADTSPPAAVTGLAASGATTTSATLTWTAPGDDGSAGTASTYDVRYSTTAITEANWVSASQCSGEPTPKAAGSAETFTVTGLTANTTYYFAMKTADEVPNWSALSNVVSKKTEGVPPAVLGDSVGPVPLQVLSPVVGPLEMVGKFNACSNKKWCFVQGDTEGHVENKGVGLANDNMAWDVNLNTPMWVSDPNWNCDAGKPVYAIAAGVVAQTYGSQTNAGGSYGQLLIEHTYQGSTWWSGYLHMKNIQVTVGQTVTETTLLGYISNVSPDNITDHLHLVVYTGSNSSGGLVSFNTTITERDQGPRVEDVAPGTGKRGQHLTVTVSGSNLNGATAVSFGSGITVSDPSAVSDTEITVEITIDANADLGKRDVSVTTWCTVTMTGGFKVVASGSGPICGGGALATPGAPSEMTTVLAALGLMFGVGYLLVRKGARNRLGNAP